MWLHSVFPHLMKHEFDISGCLNDSSFQQSKLESLKMYTLKVIKLTKVSWNTPSIIAYKSANNITIRGGSWNIQLFYILFSVICYLLLLVQIRGFFNRYRFSSRIMNYNIPQKDIINSYDIVTQEFTGLHEKIFVN